MVINNDKFFMVGPISNEKILSADAKSVAIEKEKDPRQGEHLGISV